MENSSLLKLKNRLQCLRRHGVKKVENATINLVKGPEKKGVPNNKDPEKDLKEPTRLVGKMAKRDLKKKKESHEKGVDNKGVADGWHPDWPRSG